jgi:hypothetical protein
VCLCSAVKTSDVSLLQHFSLVRILVVQRFHIYIYMNHSAPAAVSRRLVCVLVLAPPWCVGVWSSCRGDDVLHGI